MQRTAEIDPAFDIDHLALAETDPRRDAAGLAEREIAQLQDRQTVHLPCDGAVCVDQDCIALDLLVGQIPDPVSAENLLIDRLLHMRSRHPGCARLPRPIAGLPQHVEDIVNPRGQPLPVIGEPRRPLDDARHSTSLQRTQAFLPLHLSDQPGELLLVFRRPGDAGVKFRLHLEQLAELGIAAGQQIVDLRIAQQHDLHVKRDWLRLQGDRAGISHELRRCLDSKLIAKQRALQLLVDKGMGQQFARIQNQVTAIGPVQGARTDQHMVSHQRAEFHRLLNPADDIGQGRRILEHHGRAILAAVADDHVDPVAAQGLLGAPHETRRVGICVGHTDAGPVVVLLTLHSADLDEIKRRV